MAEAVGAWGVAGDVILSMLPIIVLLLLTLIPPGMPAHKTLPIAAIIAWFIHLAYIGTDSAVVNAAVLSGGLSTLTPLTIIAAAMFLFKTMEETRSMAFVVEKIKVLTKSHPVAEVYLISWAFAYLIEGASGFGTPVALASPLLAELGHDPVNAMTCGLIMNTLATVFGAAGTPVNFGLDGIGITPEDMVTIGFRSSILVAAAAPFVTTLAALFLLPFKEIARNGIFVALSVTSCVAPALGLSAFSVEFPSLIGGLIGFLITGVLVRFNVGLRPVHKQVSGKTLEEGNKDEKNQDTKEDPCSSYDPRMLTRSGSETSIKNAPTGFDGDSVHAVGHVEDKKSTFGADDAALIELKHMEQALDKERNWLRYISRSFPIWASVVILVFTRVPAFGLRDLLRAKSPDFTIDFLTLGQFKLSAALVFSLEEVFKTDAKWSYELLYTPALLPFVITSVASVAYFRLAYKAMPFRKTTMKITSDVCGRLAKPAVALTFALVLVTLMRTGEETSPAFLIGDRVAAAVAQGWLAFAFILGGLGSFFSGSTTVSNLTFGAVQKIASEQAGVSETGLLALQSAGATAGNMICLSNIVNAAAVMGLSHLNESVFLKKTIPAFCVFYIISTALGSVLILTVWA